MAIDPNLVSIIPASELPTGVPTTAGQFFFYEGDEMKKSPMTEIYELVSSSQSIGAITPSSTIPTEGNVWGFAGEGTYPNAGNITVAAGKFAILSRVGTTWSKVEVDVEIPLSTSLNPINTTEATTGKAVADYIPKSAATPNLFDKTKVVEDKYFVYNATIGANYTAILGTSTDWWTSYKIDVVAGESYVKATSTLGFFDVNDNFIKGHAPSDNSVMIAPTGSVYARLSGIDSQRDTAMLVKGTVLPSYVAGEYKVALSVLPVAPSITETDTRLVKSIDVFGHVKNAVSGLIKGTTAFNKNLFNKNTVTRGYYYNTSGVKTVASGWWYSDKINVSQGVSYATVGAAFIEFDVNGNFVKYNPPSSSGFIPQTATAYVIASGIDPNLNSVQIEVGTFSTFYESGIERITKEQIVDFYKESNTIIVSKTGTFNTIKKARDWILYNGNYSLNNRWTIIVMHGVYEEVVNIQGMYISLVGIDKYSCVIIDKSGQYANAPINMGGGNLIANLTVIASHENVGSYTGEPSYAVHHDYNGEGASLIYNCTLKSYQSCAVGIGLQNNQQLTIKDSELLTDTTGVTYTGVGKPTLLMHPQVTTATNQKLIVDNCRLKCNGGIVMNLIDSNNNGASGGSADNRDTTLTFYNNILWSDVNGKINVVTGTSAMGDGDYGYMKITGDSFGNNVGILNK